MKQHQGWIELESQVGRGTTFKAFWPVTTLKRPAKAVEPSRPKTNGGAETILLVEDEAAVRKLAAAALRKTGYHVLEAGCGSEAIEVWRSQQPRIALLVTDLVMPGGMTGLELAEKLRGEQPSLKIICASGYSQELVENGKSSRCQFPFISKPYRLDRLRELVRECLDR